MAIRLRSSLDTRTNVRFSRGVGLTLVAVPRAAVFLAASA